MAYDSGRQRVVLYGGGLTGETWEWDGIAWEQVALVGPQPGIRNSPGMAYDAARGEVVMFGGNLNLSCSFGNNYLGDTWTWNGSQWFQAATTPPSRRGAPLLAYDPIRQRAVLAGGLASCGFDLAETWEWDGQVWVQVAATTHTEGRDDTAAYYPPRGTILLFGGLIPPGTFSSGLLEWNGSVWSSVPQGSPPPGRGSHAMAYDAARDRLVVVGGNDAIGPCGFADTWEFDGATWRRVDSGPDFPGVASASAVFDEARGYVVLFGGRFNGCSQFSGDTWVWTARPVLTSRPQPVSLHLPGTAEFFITSIGTGPFTHQWQAFEGGAWANLTDGARHWGSVVHGALTDELRIDNAQTLDSTLYRCMVSNGCGDSPSDPAKLTICYADCDTSTGPAVLDFFDFICFQDRFGVGDPYACDCDLSTGVGVCDFFDFICFQDAFSAGCP